MHTHVSHVQLPYTVEWWGHSRLGVTDMCGRDIHMWELLTCVRDIHMCSGGSKGGCEGRAPPLAHNFFIFMQFSGKIDQIIGWRPPLWG